MEQITHLRKHREELRGLVAALKDLTNLLKARADVVGGTAKFRAVVDQIARYGLEDSFFFSYSESTILGTLR